MSMLERETSWPEWLAENATLTLMAFRKFPPRCHGMPAPNTWGYELLLEAERGAFTLKEVAKKFETPDRFSTNVSLRSTCYQFVERGLLVRVRHGVYAIGPWGLWWVGLQKAIGGAS